MKHVLKKLTASLLTTAVLASSAAAGSIAVSAKTAEYPTIGYDNTICSLDDYKLAVKRRFISVEERNEALAAADRKDAYVDNSKLKYFPKIGDQNPLGTCVAFSCVYYQFTHEVNKALDRAATDSTTMQPMFIYNLYNGCNKPRHIEGLLYGTGCAPVSMVPDFLNDKTWSADYDIWREAVNYRMYDYLSFATIGEPGREVSSVDDPDLAAVKAALRNGDILSYAGPIGDYQFTTIPQAAGVDAELVGHGIVTKAIGSGVANHMMTIVGYNDNIWVDLNNNGKADDGEKGALKIANSWGDTWGDYRVAADKRDGFFWIAYDALNKKSVVDGVTSESNRAVPIYGPGRFLVSKTFGTSGIFLYFKLNSDNRTDSYVEVTAKKKTDGTVYTRQVNPYYFADFTTVSSQKLNYMGKTGFCDGAMVADMNTIVPEITSQNLHDYDWSFRFVDSGSDSSATTVKEAFIKDENTNTTYPIDGAFPFTLNKTQKTLSLKPYYHFSKLYLPEASAITVNSNLKFTFKTANETLGSSPIKYTMTVSKDGKTVFTKQHKATSVDKATGSSVIKGTWKPTATGAYTITITGTDAAGKTASRSADFRVYNKLLAVRAINLDKSKYLKTYDSVKITPQITGGTAPYTYSYYYVKGGKTVKIAENTKSTYKTKTFNHKTGKYTLLVKVKDATGAVAQSSISVVVYPAEVKQFVYNNNAGKVGDSIYIRADVNDCPSCIKDTQYIYTVEKNGKVETLNYSDVRYPNQVVWKPTEGGTYNLTCTVKNGDKVLASKTVPYKVSTFSINVNVITYVCNKYGTSNFTIRYWDKDGKIGDAKCTALNTTKQYNVGFWNTAQPFRQFKAEIPTTSVGFKFHIGNTWFGDTDGNTTSHNTVYAFNYDYDRCKYTKE